MITNSKKLNTLALLVLAISFASCTKKSKVASNDLLQITAVQSEDLTQKLSSPAELCQYLSSQNYYNERTKYSGREVAYSTSYGVDTKDSSRTEKGQAFGTVDNDGFFVQDNFVTTQILICPGAFNGLYSGKCAWNVQDYAKLAFEIVCNKARRFGSPSKFHPGYASHKVKKLSEFTASTAGKTYKYGQSDEVLEIELESASKESSAFIYFAKGLGFIASEFRESTAPDGTVKVYIGRPGT